MQTPSEVDPKLAPTIKLDAYQQQIQPEVLLLIRNILGIDTNPSMILRTIVESDGIGFFLVTTSFATAVKKVK